MRRTIKAINVIIYIDGTQPKRHTFLSTSETHKTSRNSDAYTHIHIRSTIITVHCENHSPRINSATYAVRLAHRKHAFIQKLGRMLQDKVKYTARGERVSTDCESIRMDQKGMKKERNSPDVLSP